MVVFIALLASALRLATPLIFSALGGVFTERSGITNIALEGMMIMGAFFAILVTEFTNMPWLGVLAAMVAGILTSMILAVLSIHLKGNQVVVGTAINLFATSITAFLLELVWKRSGQTDSVERALTTNPFHFLENIPLIGKLFSGMTPFVYLAFVAVAVSYYVLYKTPFGLRIRAVGEHPRAADTVGINVYKIRYICVGISGMMAGISGASMSLGTISLFREGMTSGKGFIALAAMIFGKWHPVGAMFASLFFGFCEALQIQASTLGFDFVPSEFLQMLPYVATIIVLSGFIGRAVAPKAVGTAYEKGHR
ncbi:ABC transporter permease [Fusibacter ferrireducens]|uniref:ABC transporter permease n=1 Tax=Fusibacter ferrireducens TaxID=2785058 RepID=A0ABR9ZV31_9FIRM|nr:ABC transporter permease [Fusibacter ferrireducens]MBF4694023.1 ABC transporter permease [Fusibacter ferrireducens]